jgi:hypothetical protein
MPSRSRMKNSARRRGRPKMQTPFVHQCLSLARLALDGALAVTLKGPRKTGKSTALHASVDWINQGVVKPPALFVPASQSDHAWQTLQMLHRAVCGLDPLEWVAYDPDALAKTVAEEVIARSFHLLVIDHQLAFSSNGLYAAWLVRRFCREKGHPLGVIVSGVQMVQFGPDFDAVDISRDFTEEIVKEKQFEGMDDFLAILKDMASEAVAILKAAPEDHARRWIKEAIEATGGNIGGIAELAHFLRLLGPVSLNSLDRANQWYKTGRRPVQDYGWDALPGLT